MAKTTELKEVKEFIKDNCKTASAKNRKLATHLGGIWLKLEIVKIKRIEIGCDSGWQAAYRE